MRAPPESEVPKAPRARPRRTARHVTAILWGLVFVELAAWGLYWFRNGEPMPLEELTMARRHLAEGGRVEQPLPEADPQDTHDDWVTHPYIGYVLDPEPDDRLNDDVVYVVGTSEQPPSRREDRLIVGLFGGSVGFHLGFDFTEIFRNALADEYPDREIVLVVAATPSWKQPQMLFSLQWLALRGYEYDVVVEVDGFNECVGATANHIYYGVNAAYPPNYRAFVASKAEGPDYMAAAGEIDMIHRRRRERAGWLIGPLVYSPTANLVWSTWDQGQQHRLEMLRTRLVELVSPDVRRYGQRGPVDELGDRRGDRGPLYDELARVWLESNLHMGRLARAMGADLVVFLQPNQYHLDGQKPFSAWEREHARSTPRFGRWVRGCYPRLIDAAPALEEADIGFEDLTPIFADEPATVYRDACCHYNERGNRRLAAAIAEALRRRGAGLDTSGEAMATP
ncbi:MAG TPA: hypothetical protein RMH99_21135 [Sandaracinaceae bacterium LLY-WYZ-13_1]|nr:hypothetical protein [Sandaracinaceae bacterium LLY-WYZ-13_1]